MKEVAFLNMCVILVTLEVSKFETSPLKEVASSNIELMSVTLEVSKFDKSLLNKLAPLNIDRILVTLDVFHNKSPLKELALKNIVLVLATLDVFHPLMSSLKVFISSNNHDMSLTLPTHHEFIGQPYVWAIGHTSLLAQT